MVSGNKKYANEILDDVECYKAVLDGRLKQFPKGFWTKPWSKQSSAVLTRYLLEERLKYTEEDIKTKVVEDTFSDNGLTGILRLFNRSIYNILDNAYPGRFKVWEISQVPNGFWRDTNNVKDVVRWIVETKLENNRERICKEFNHKLLSLCKLSTLRNYSVHTLLGIAYPNEFKPWELSQVPDGFWEDRNNVKEAIKWLIDTKLDGDRDRVCKEFNRKLITRNGMSRLVVYGMYELINIAYPNEFKPWEFGRVRKGFWSEKNNVIEAVRWLVETKLDNNRERICREFNNEFIVKNGLVSINRYGIYNLINMAYPNEFKPWELPGVPKGFWCNRDNIKQAIRWLVETKLGSSKQRVCSEFNHKLLNKNNLGSLADLGMYTLINMAYPNKFKLSDFKNIRNIEYDNNEVRGML